MESKAKKPKKIATINSNGNQVPYL